jgi:hypothetical protein
LQTGFATFVNYLPQLIGALLILQRHRRAADLYRGGRGRRCGRRTMGDTPTGRVVRAAAPALIMAIAVFMILTQLGIATVIVVITYTALIGAVALGAALAFGLGGRDAAAQLIDSGYRKAQDNADQVRSDVQVGRKRAERDARQATATASAWADDTDQQSTARLDRDYTDTGTTTPGNGSAGMNPAHDARGAGAHRDR